MRRGTISWGYGGLNSGTAAAAKARKKVSSPLHTYSVQAKGSACALEIRLPELRGLTRVLLDSKEATNNLNVQMFSVPD